MHAMTPHASIANVSDKPRRTLILSYRAADAFPIYTGEMTYKTEANARLVRGRVPHAARFEERSFPIPAVQGRYFLALRLAGTLAPRGDGGRIASSI